MLRSWLRRAYPISDLVYEQATLWWTWSTLPPRAGCGGVNSKLATMRTLDRAPPTYLPVILANHTSQ